MSASRAVWSISWAPVRSTDTAESKRDGATVPFFVKKDICEKEMGLELRLEWYDTATLEFQGEETSKDLGDDESVLNALGIPVEGNINNGGFNVVEQWVATIQPYFQHQIALSTNDYQVSFDYS